MLGLFRQSRRLARLARICTHLCLVTSLGMVFPISPALASSPNTAVASTSVQPFFDHIATRANAAGTPYALMIRPRSSHGMTFKNYVQHRFQEVRALKAQGGAIAQMMTTARVQLENSDLTSVQLNDVLANAHQTILGTDFEALAANRNFQRMINVLSDGLEQSFFGGDVIAALYGPDYFFKILWGRNLLQWGITIASSFGGVAPGVNVAIALFEKAIDEIILRRDFYQNFALHYLQAVPASDLGLNSEAVARTLSSLYESRINWYDFKKSSQAKANWMAFGQSENVTDRSKCDAKVAKYGGDYPGLGSSYDFVFYPVSGKRPMVINFRNGRSLVEKQPSLALDFANPNTLFHIRLLSEIFLFALSASPAPGVLVTVVKTFVESTYIPQIASEGALLAHFASLGDVATSKLLIRQTVNPFIMADWSQ